MKFVSLRTSQFIEMFMEAFLHKVGDNKIGVGKLRKWFDVRIHNVSIILKLHAFGI